MRSLLVSTVSPLVVLGGSALADDAPVRVETEPELIVVEDSAGPIDTPGAGVRVVGAGDLARVPRKHADDLLRVVPGLYLSQHGSEGKAQQFFLRGFDAVHGADLAIRVGGIPINELSNVHGQGYADLGFVIPETVASLVSRKGPFALEQGWFATAGSVDLELAIPARRGRRVGYELGTTTRHRLVVVEAPEDAPAAELVAAEFVHDAGYGEDRHTTRGTVVAQTELGVGRWRLRPLAIGYWSGFGEPGVIARGDIAAGLFDRLDAPAGDLGGRSQRLLAGLGATWSRGDDDLRGVAHLGWRGLALDQNFTGYLVSAEHGDARRQEHRAITGGALLAWRRRLTGHLRVFAGAEVLRDELDQAEARISTAGVAWRDERSLAASTTTGASWLGLEARRGRWTATGGARVDAMLVTAADRLDPMRSGSGAVWAVSPRLAVAWRHERGSVSAAIGRGVRPPEARAFTRREARENMDTTVYDGGEPEITAATAAELGGELRWERAAVGVTGFATWIERESIFDHVSGASAARDGSRRLGAELFAELVLLPGLALRGDVTSVDARFEITGNPVPGAPRLLASAEARFERGAWSAGLAGRFLGARPLQHGATAASSTVLDALGTWTRGRWTLALQLDNVLGTEWNEGEYHFASWWDTSRPRSEIPRVHIAPGRPFGARLGATVAF